MTVSNREMEHKGFLRFHPDVQGPLSADPPGVGDYVYDPEIPPPPGAYASSEPGAPLEYAPVQEDDIAVPLSPSKVAEIKCFWCCDWFTGACVGLPKWFDATEGTYVTRGTYCSVNCAAAHALSDSSVGSHQCYSLLCMMAEEMGMTPEEMEALMAAGGGGGGGEPDEGMSGLDGGEL